MYAVTYNAPSKLICTEIFDLPLASTFALLKERHPAGLIIYNTSWLEAIDFESQQEMRTVLEQAGWEIQSE